MIAQPEIHCGRCGARTMAPGSLCTRCLLEESEQDTFGGYFLEEELGRGGMGTVFKARHARLGRMAAVKVLDPSVAAQQDVRTRFVREGRALAKLQHPGVVRLYELGEDEGELFLAMEYVEGGTLASRCPLPPAEALRVIAEVCDALEAAHQMGIIHRDIKPQNVLLTREGAVKVSDFGIARLLSPEDRGLTVTQQGQALGSAGYVAPEAMAGAAPHPSMDIYAAGALLRTLVTGRAPVGEMNELSGPCAPIIRKAMAHDPSQRFASAARMGAECRRARIFAQSPELPADEVLWVRAVALIGTAAVGACLLAFLWSVTPQVLRPDETPLLIAQVETLADGRRISRLHFEPVATLAAVAAMGLSVAAYGLLRRHWRKEGLDAPRPDEPLTGTRIVWILGLVAMASYGLRILAETNHWVSDSSWVLSVAPLLGGLFEIVALYLFLACVLEAFRRSRSLHREPALLAGMALTVAPPAIRLFETLLKHP